MEEYKRYDPNDFYPNGQSFEVDSPAFITHFTHKNFKEIFWKIVYTWFIFDQPVLKVNIMVIAGKCLNHQFIFFIHKFFPIKFVLWISSYIKKQMLIKWLWKILNSYKCTYMKQKHFLKACINYEYWSKRSF